MPAPPRKCRNCSNWFPNMIGDKYQPNDLRVKSLEECRFGPPAVVDSMHHAWWPKTKRDDGCGKHTYANGAPLFQ